MTPGVSTCTSLLAQLCEHAAASMVTLETFSLQGFIVTALVSL